MSITAIIGFAWLAFLAGTTCTAWLRRARPPLDWVATRKLRVRVVRPCAGAPAHLLRALTGLPTVPEGVELEVILSVSDEADPAWPLAVHAAARLRGSGVHASARVLAGQGLNLKVTQLGRAAELPGPTPDVLLNMDSDVDPRGLDLSGLLRPLLGTGAAALTWLPPVEVERRTLADRASNAFLSTSLHAFTLLAALDRGGVTGKVFAIRTDALARIGGFSAVSNVLGEDMAMSEILHERGFRTEAVHGVCHSLMSGRGARAVAARYARWLTVIRQQRPRRLWGYPFVLGAWPLVVALGIVTGGSAGSALVGSAVASRMVVSVLARRASGLPAGNPAGLILDTVLADLVLWAALLGALRRPTVSWRGRTLLVGPGGVLRDPAND